MKKDGMSKYLDESDSEQGSSDHKYDAKMGVLNELREMAMNMMGNKVKNHMSPKANEEQMAEVSVKASDAPHLAEGLKMAQNVMPQQNHDTASAMGTPDSEQYSEDDDMDIEEIESLIAELEDKRKEKMLLPRG